MAEELHPPHDALVRTVLRDRTAATSFLPVHLPAALSQGLNWATLTLVEGSFVDEEFRASEADLLYEVAQVTGDTALWLYVLVEHQSTPDRWMRLRLLKYCCRIWQRQLTERPMPRELRPIVPLVFYQEARSWTYSPEFAELFAEAVRDWPWVPRLRHGLIDQSALAPEELPGDLPVRLMQIVLLVASPGPSRRRPVDDLCPRTPPRRGEERPARRPDQRPDRRGAPRRSPHHREPAARGNDVGRYRTDHRHY